MELLFALLGVVWWLAAAIIVMRHTTVDANTQPGGVRVVSPGAASLPSPPPPPPPPFPPPPLAPGANSTDGTGAGGGGGDQDLGQQLGEFVQALLPRSLPQWRQALVVMAWVTMGLFALEALLLSVGVRSSSWVCGSGAARDPCLVGSGVACVQGRHVGASGTCAALRGWWASGEGVGMCFDACASTAHRLNACTWGREGAHASACLLDGWVHDDCCGQLPVLLSTSRSHNTCVAVS